ncbi:hypothetical protein ACVOMV_07370 [Mesorhizobium atlanticum]
MAAAGGGAKPAILARENAETHDVALIDHVRVCSPGTARAHPHAAVASAAARQDLSCRLRRLCSIDEPGGRIGFGEEWLDLGAVITLDGNSGTIFAGASRTPSRCRRSCCGGSTACTQKTG